MDRFLKMITSCEGVCIMALLLVVMCLFLLPDLNHNNDESKEGEVASNTDPYNKKLNPSEENMFFRFLAWHEANLDWMWGVTFVLMVLIIYCESK